MIKEVKKEGRIIFWNGIYGFISQEDDKSIFFHKSNITDSETTCIGLLCDVAYVETISRHNKYRGRSIADKITLMSDVNFNDYTRHVGRLTVRGNSNGKVFWEIESPQQDDRVTFYETRALQQGVKFKKNDIVIFHQVKSSKDPRQRFALFAYPLTQEKDIAFLQQLYVDSQISNIKEYIDDEFLSKNVLTNEESFIHTLIEIDYVDDTDKYLRLKQEILSFKELNYRPSIDLLSKYCSKVYLIQLWREKIIDDYDLSTIKVYFHNSRAPDKRMLYRMLKKTDKDEVIAYHFEQLVCYGQLKTLNNKIKTLLDIIYREELTRNINVYNRVKNYLLENLKKEDTILLWLSGYIDTLPERYILDNIDVSNEGTIGKLLTGKDGKYQEVLRKVYEDYFLNFSSSDFNEELSDLVSRLKIFKEEFKDAFDNFAGVVRVKLDQYQLFVLSIFDVSIGFDYAEYFKNHHNQLNDYYKVRYILKQENIPHQLFEEITITEEGLQIYIDSSPWNRLISPTSIISSEETEYEYSFLADLKRYISRFNISNIDLDNVSEYIYHAIAKYQVHHIRLWLNDYVNSYDYVGYRKCFTELTLEEQKIFKNASAEFLSQGDVVDGEFEMVIPCTDFDSHKGNGKLYRAFIPNIYFGNGYVQLRLDDGKYTETYTEEFASTGLNRIPKSNILCKIQIEIQVSDDNTINSITGFDEILAKIHTGYIEKVLGIVESGNGVTKRQNLAYVEDWALRKNVIDFLNENQVQSVELKFVHEPKIHYGRSINGMKEVDLEKVVLYTIEAEGGFAIVWENIDLNDDRATYVFKTLVENHSSQLERIAHCIASYALLRSALSSKVDDVQLQIFKDHLGFITSIRKQRGSNDAFDNWEQSFSKYLLSSIPDMPSESEIQALESWKPKIIHSPRINTSRVSRSSVFKKGPKKIDQTTVKSGDIHESGGSKPIKSRASENKHLQELFSILKTFNDTIQIDNK